jgi:hypothetical protein
MAVVCLLALYYVVSANAVASTTYAVTMIEQETSVLVEHATELAAQRAAIDDPVALTAFAYEHHMVPAQEREVLFSQSEVALRP